MGKTFVPSTMGGQDRAEAKASYGASVGTPDIAERQRQQRAARALVPSPLVGDSARLGGFGRQIGIPAEVVEMERRTRGLVLSDWEQEAIRASLNSPTGLLRQVLRAKTSAAGGDPSGVYIRVDCFGMEVQSPCLLEIWRGGHVSPIHEHAGSHGIVRCLAGRVEMTLYESLDAAVPPLGLVELNPGQTSWLSPDRYQTHRVRCPMSEYDFAATFHVYENCRDEYFHYLPPMGGEASRFLTKSDLTWEELERALEAETPRYRGER